MPTANEEAFDRTLRRKVFVLRFAEGEAERVSKLLAEVEQDLLDKISGALTAGLSRRRLESLLRSVQALQAQAFDSVASTVEADMEAFAKEEAGWERAMLEEVLPVVADLAVVPLETLRAAANSPVRGMTVKGWLDGIEASCVANIERAIRLGASEGETVPQIVGRIRGTRANGYTDGVLQATRREAEALVRTAVNHVSNQAREQVWLANQDVILCLRWTSTLDGRTTDICRARDGRMAPVGGMGAVPDDVSGDRLDPPGARPPAHFNCRSVMVPIISAAGVVGNRPYVNDNRTRAQREVDFRALAKEQGISVQQARADWASQAVGQVPAKTTYSEWLGRQPVAFQDEVLGKARADLFRNGTTLDKFVDYSGRRLTLKQLKASGY